MRRVTINNFRCYESISIDFRRGINLLIGDNSVGKTSLLRACNLVMNAFFCGYSDENTKWKSAEDDDFREIKNDDVATDESLSESCQGFPLAILSQGELLCHHFLQHQR